MRLLQRPQCDRHVVVDVVLALVGERIGGQTGTDAGESVEENIARIVVLDLVVLELVGRHAAADADVEPAIAQVIEHADFLDQAQRRIERQQINQRAKPHTFGRPRDGAEIDAGHRHQVERRGMMLGNVKAIKACGIRRFDKAQALVEQRRQRPIAMLDVIE
jgi:hypothetical protein